jgi:hypothetical protein
MTAAELLQALRDAGVVVTLNWDKVRLEGEVPNGLVDLCRRHKPELITLLAIEDFAAKFAAWEASGAAPALDKTLHQTCEVKAPQWSAIDADLVAWVAALTAAEVPASPFLLRAGVTVVDAQLFLASLQAEVAAGPRTVRARKGVLQRDIEGLREAVAAIRQAVPELAQLRRLEGGKAA